MVGFDAGFIPQLLCVGETSPSGVALALTVLVMSLVVGIGLAQSPEPRRRSTGRFMCLGAWTGLGAHAVFAALLRLA